VKLHEGNESTDAAIHICASAKQNGKPFFDERDIYTTSIVSQNSGIVYISNQAEGIDIACRVIFLW
jgi:hypothetical protein